MRRSLIAASTAATAVGAFALVGASSASAAALQPTVASNYSSAQGLVALAYNTILANDEQYASNGAPYGDIVPTSALQTFINSDGELTPSQISTDVTPAFGAAVWATLSGDGFTAAGENDEAAGDVFGDVVSAAYTSDPTGVPAAVQAMVNDAGSIGLSAILATPANVVSTTSDTLDVAITGMSSLQPLVALAADDLADFPNALYSVDGDVNVSSSATVTAIGKPTAYSTTFGVNSSATGGYVLPSGFTLTFPADFTINTALVGSEITAAQESNPPAANAIGTASVTSPVISVLVPGSKGVDSTATVYAVATSSLTQPDFEVYLGQNDYILGTLTGVTFPLTVTFGEPVVGGQATPLPVSSVTMSFPAATSPLEATSCTSLGELTGTMTDGASAVAALAGDTADSGAIAMNASATTVTDDCTAAVTAVKPTLSGSASGLTNGKPTFTLKVKTATAFSSVTVSLPSGLKFVKKAAKKLAKEISASGAKIKSVRISRGKLVITFKSKVTSVTLKAKKGLVSETSGLIKKIKKHKTKKLTFKIKAGSTSLSTRVKA
jgi:hypothetical protein